MKDSYPSIHYQDVKQISYLTDLKRQGKQDRTQNFNSDRQTFSSIAQKLYKKIIQQGYIQKPKDFAIPQTRKKVQHMYDLSDKWIDDQEVFTEAESEKTFSDFSQYRAISNVSIEEFYQNLKGSKLQIPQKIQAEQKPQVQTMKLNDYPKTLTVVKYDELKKKIQTNMKKLTGSK